MISSDCRVRWVGETRNGKASFLHTFAERLARASGFVFVQSVHAHSQTGRESSSKVPAAIKVRLDNDFW